MCIVRCNRFFFEGNGDRRDLHVLTHSFPTRRSSDLAAVADALGSIVFTWVGARIALGIDPIALRRIYALFVLCVAVFYFYQSRRAPRLSAPSVTRRKPQDFHKGWFALLGVFAGLASGIFGVGGSVLAVPVLTTVFRYSQTGGQALALTMIIPGLLVALFTYASHGQVDWLAGLSMALGSVFLVPYGVRLASALPEPRLQLTFACKIGRASCRERVCQYVYILVVAVSLKK